MMSRQSRSHAAIRSGRVNLRSALGLFSICFGGEESLMVSQARLLLCYLYADGH